VYEFDSEETYRPLPSRAVSVESNVQGSEMERISPAV
jgi:hypothetical protein